MRNPNRDEAIKAITKSWQDLKSKIEREEFTPPLHMNVMSSDIAGLRMTLNGIGVDVNQVDSNGKTALMIAIARQNLDAVALLLHNGATVSHQIMPKASSISRFNIECTLLSHWILQSNGKPYEIEAIKQYISDNDINIKTFKELLLNQINKDINSMNMTTLKALSFSCDLPEVSSRNSMISDIQSKLKDALENIQSDITQKDVVVYHK